MPEVDLSAGTIEYEDTGGSGPVVVFVHGLMMDGSLWRKVVQICVPTIAACCRRCRSAVIAARCAPTRTCR